MDAVQFFGQMEQTELNCIKVIFNLYVLLSHEKDVSIFDNRIFITCQGYILGYTKMREL